mgnify:FL=1
MKIINWLFPVIAFVLAVSSCNENEAVREMLDKADSLLIGKSDSALILLDSYQAEKDSYCKSQRMRYEMLRALAQNTEDVLFTSDSILLEVVDYYESHGTDHDRMRANYALGCAYRDLGDAPRAIQYYNDAVSYADTTSLHCDYRTLSRIYGQMASVYHSQRVPRLELESEQNAVESSWKANDTIAALIFEEHMSDAFGLSREYDSVLYILDKVKREYEALGLNQMAARSVLNTIGILLDRDSLLEAKKRIDLYVNKSGYFDENGDIKTGLEHFYNNLGLYYEKTEQIDSAYFYYNKSLMNKISIPSKSIAYRGLLRIAMLKGNIEQVYEYAQRYSASKDTEVFLHSQEEITQAQALYNYNTAQRQLEQEKEESIKYKNGFIYATIIFIFVLVVISFFVINIRTKNREEIQSHNRAYSELLSRYSNAIRDFNQLKEDSSLFEKNKVEEISQLRESLSVFTKGIVDETKWNADANLNECEIIKQLHKQATTGQKMTTNQMLDLFKFIEDVLPEFYNRISTTQDLTQKEKIVCILIRLQFIPSQIGILLDIKPQYLTNIRSKVNLKLFKAKGTKNLDENIFTL